VNRIIALLLAVTLLTIAACENKPLPLPSASRPAAQVVQPSNPNNPVVVIETSMGTITAELYEDEAPITVENFLAYVDDKYYDGTLFHRVVPERIIQGGGYEAGMKEKKQRDPIKNESYNGLSNQRGTLAMARLDAPDTAAAGFFINTLDNIRLDHARAPDKIGYCVFGKVLTGMDVVNQIERVPTEIRDVQTEVNAKIVAVPFEDVPVKDVVIKSIRRAN
jgi:cyclophilin family peptidyl-prolyl cis-trans isomerase/predicted small lipoprotein YifL